MKKALLDCVEIEPATPARFAVIYEVGGIVVCYCLLDSAPADVTATDGNTLTVTMNASGVFTVA